MNELSRRGFLKLGGGIVAGAGVVVAGTMAGVTISGSAEAATGESDQAASFGGFGRGEALQERSANVASFISKVSEEV
ncbi:MAG: hypothetical protein K8H75_13790 [Sulfuricella sp.]|nr:hypothetical protein [Sulfuricella sp.]